MNLASSIRARLLNLARAEGIDFNLVLVTYALQRVLYRLSQTSRDRFVLKGAHLLQQLLPDIGHRPTRDADLAALEPLDEGAIRELFVRATGLEVADGIIFKDGSFRVEALRGQAGLGGTQVFLTATLDGARIPVRIDISSTDAVVPDPVDITFRTFLDLPAPTFKGYAIETVIAEKLHAIAALGLVNTRLKDYYDLWVIKQHFTVRESELARALLATFTNRSTPIQANLTGLSPTFFENPERVRMWERTLKTMGAVPVRLAAVCAEIETAFGPALTEASHD